MQGGLRIPFLSRCGKPLSACGNIFRIEPFSDLLVAFRRDQSDRRHPTWNSVLGYCRYSANPVGRLVLYLCGYRDARRQKFSDATCTALQLANFWQDVARDLEKGRIYIPLETLAAHGLTEDDILARRFDGRYVSLMKELIARTRDLFAQGMPLAGSVDSALRVDLELFSRGGLAVLDSIEAIGYNTLEHRPSISKSKQLQLLGSALLQRVFGMRQVPVAIAAVSAVPGRLAIVPGGCTMRHPTFQPLTIKLALSYAECRRVARNAASNFYYAFYMLPQSQARRTVRALRVYAARGRRLRLRRQASATSNADWHAGGRRSMRPLPGTSPDIRSFRPSQTRSSAPNSARAISTI